MLDYIIIQNLREKTELPEDVFEKDYLIELLLYYISQNDFLVKRLIFRGGTALKKVYFPDYRYSEDMDFIVTSSARLNVFVKEFTDLAELINRDFPAELKIQRYIFPQRGHLQIFLSYNLVPEITANKELKIDIVQDDMFLPYKERNIIFTYHDFERLQCKLNVADSESIFVDKIGRILDVVDEPRDLWDLLHLLKSKLKISKIKKQYKIKYGIPINQKNLLNAVTKTNYKNLWKTRLEHQIPDLISYEKFIVELVSIIKSRFN